LDDYLKVDEDAGTIKIWWNFGADLGYPHGWKWVERKDRFIAGPLKHLNLATLRFPDLNGDGRADLSYVGKDGAVRSWLNVGRPGDTELVWHDLGGVAKGAVGDIFRLVFADVSFSLCLVCSFSSYARLFY
jgi:hypothetical protein